MRNLIRYLIRNHVILLFLALEVVSFYLIVNYNNYQEARSFSSANYITGILYKNYSRITDYFTLSETNKKLSDENARLKSIVEYYKNKGITAENFLLVLPNNELLLKIKSARVINNSTNKQHNFITLDKGRKDGIRPGQGVLEGSSVIGQITNVSESFSVAISLLNTRWSISAKLKRNNYFGTLEWDGGNYRYADLREIPLHVPLAVGDTIVTSGFSSIFPEGQTIGIIEEFDQRSGGSFYRVRIKLAVDFKSVAYVNIIEIPSQSEIRLLEKSAQND